jgi:hypothetical protein
VLESIRAGIAETAPYVILPTGKGQLIACYLVWVVPYLAINIIWDISSPRTERFHLSKLQTKTNVVHAAALLCSSVLLICALFSETTEQLTNEMAVPLALASLSGILQAFSGLCPYEVEREPLLPLNLASAAGQAPAAIQAKQTPHP